MKSTLKIDTESRNEGEIPVIKIVQPIEVFDENNKDYDIRDKLIKNFLHTPCMSERNHFFELATYFPIPFEGKTELNVSTISAIPRHSLFYRFRHTILNNIVAEDSIIELNTIKMKSVSAFDNIKNGKQPAPKGFEDYVKIHDFFDWVDDMLRHNHWDKCDKSNHKTVRWYYEMCLRQEPRMKAFSITPKEKLDDEAESLLHALNLGFDAENSPEWLSYWKGIFEERQPKDVFSELGNILRP